MSSTDGFFANMAPSSASQLSLAVLQRLKAMPSWKMTLTEQLLVILLDSFNTRISVLELSRERIEIENRRIKQLFYFIGAWTSVISVILGALGINIIDILNTVPTP